MNSGWGLTRTLGVMMIRNRSIVCFHTSHSSGGRRDQGRTSVSYRSARSACSHVYPKGESARRHPSHHRTCIITKICARPQTLFSDYRYPVSGLILPRWVFLRFGAHSWPFTRRTPSHLPPPTSPNLALVGVDGMKGCVLHCTNHTPIDVVHLKLPSSRPPSPPSPLPQTVASPIVGDTRTVCDPLFSIARPDADKEATHLAQEAVSEGCDGLKALLRLLEFMQMSLIHGTEELAHELGALTADFLTLTALPVLFNASAFTK